MSAENPTPNDIPQKKRRVALPKPVESPLSEDGWLKGKAHLEVILFTTCGCNSHEVGAYVCMIHGGMNNPPEMVTLYQRYAEINLKVHHSNREAGHKTPSQEAEEILIYENKKKGN